MAEGRASDNPSNANYSLQDYSTSIEYFYKRLTIAKECHDQIGQRRAHAHLGNAYLYLEDFDRALYHYREALVIGKIRNDDLFIAQISFIMGCVYNIKHEYKSAIYFHEKHLNLAEQFQDSKGQCRAYYILSQLYDKSNQYDKGKKYLNLHTTLAGEIEASNEIKSGSKNNPNKNLRAESISISLSESHIPHSTRSHSAIPSSLPDEKTMANVNKKTKLSFIQHLTKLSPLSNRKQSSSSVDPDELVDLIHNMQKSRFDDQRCDIKTTKTNKNDVPGHGTKSQLEDILNTIDRLQQFSLDDQRTNFPGPAANHNNNNNTKNSNSSPLNEQFFDQLAKCQNSRMNDQRAVLLPLPNHTTSSTRTMSASEVVVPWIPTKNCPNESASKTLPDEEFFSLLKRLQSRHTDQQQICLSSKQTHKFIK